MQAALAACRNPFPCWMIRGGRFLVRVWGEGWHHVFSHLRDCHYSVDPLAPGMLIAIRPIELLVVDGRRVNSISARRINDLARGHENPCIFSVF
ncbi:hypothetical protein Pan258_35180 [Symmachiella dynata]|nr:hypothetical protein Pan258_35180 [Symmachiella dynata]